MILKLIEKIPFRGHLIFSFLIRIVLIAYGEFQDKCAEIPFTDIDYKVVTDGARHILNDESPYQRHTYRYTPIIAYILTLNILLHDSFGKILFCVCDTLIGVIIRKIILDEYQQTFETNSSLMLQKKNKRFNERTATLRFRLQPKHEQSSTLCSLFWLYNPMAMVIATRGNGDSITSLFTLLTIFALQRSQCKHQKRKYLQVILAGLCHGFAIHFRLFPLAFSLAYYLYLSDSSSIPLQRRSKSIFALIFNANHMQLMLALTTIATLVSLTTIFYFKFGYEFLYESYIYHLVRKDTRHNFSLYFYMNLLNAEPILIEKLLTFLPQLFILLAINFNFSMHCKTLGFCIFLQSFVIVAFNPVVTSQYFIWYLAILPICLKNLRLMGAKRALSYSGLWCSVQGIWLYSAYLLEFKGWNTFGFIWMQGAIFFAVNCFIMKVFIVHFDVIADI